MKIIARFTAFLLVSTAMPSVADADSRNRDILKADQLSINSSGQISASRRAFLRSNEALYGKARKVPSKYTIAARLTKPGQAQPKSTLLTIGEAPNGFGKTLLWAPEDEGIAAVVFLNAADPYGVMISGVMPGDTIEFVSATGTASFDEDIKNEGAAAFIGVIAVGASIVASAFGAPEAAPVIQAGADYAKTRFREENVRKKRRNPFGEDPGTGHKARAEGGVLVSMPSARRAYYSGNSSNKHRWIKKPGKRDLYHRPDHVRDAFFLETNSRNFQRAAAAGDIIIYPWDHKFEDNFGGYRLHVLLKREVRPQKVIE